MRKLTFLIFICLSVLFLGTTAMAQRTASVSGVWSSTATWGGAAVPTSADAVIINDAINVTVDVAAVCASLTINTGGNTHAVTISGSNSLTVSGAVTINAPTATSKSKTIAVGSGTLSCNSILMATTSAGNRICQITLSTGTITVSGNITMNGAGLRNQVTFTDVGTVYVSGNMSGGTLNTVAGSTVNYNGINQTIGGYATYTNLTLSGSGTKTLGAASTVNGDLNLTSGTLADGGFILTLAGNLTGTGSHIGAGKISMTGSGKTISGVTLTNLELNNAGGFSLSGSPTINGALTFTSGLLTLGTNNLTLGSAATIGGTPTSSSMIVADNTGQLIKNFTGNGSFTFPVGDNTGTAEYSPVTLNFTAGTFDAGANAGINLSNSKNTNNISVTDYLNRYWTISQTGISGFSCDATLQYVVADVVGIESNIYAGSWNGLTWTLLNVADTALHQLSGTVTGFSTFTGGEQIVMPVEISAFTANVISRDVKLNWTTASELNNAGFEIQRSVRNESWVKVGYINGKGTKTTPTNYIFEDKNLNTGKYNYRLKQIDYNGNFEYFNLASEIEIGVPNKFNISQNYPNPFNPTAKIDFDLPYDSRVSIVLYDMSGREVMTLVNEQKPAGYYTLQMNANNLSSGMYFYRIIAYGNGQKYVMTKKALLIK